MFNEGQLEAIRKMEIWKSSPNEPFFILSGKSGSGKDQPNSERVLTPLGWVTMGEIRPGDYVISSEGKPTKVLSIHPQGLKEIYQVSFADGSSVRCGLDHLWEVQTNKDLKTSKVKGFLKTRVLSVSQMIEIGLKTNSGASRFSVRAFAGTQDGVSIDYAYPLGQILGDGYLSGNRLTLTCDSRNQKRILNEISPYLGDPINTYTVRGTNTSHVHWSWATLPQGIQKYKNAGKSGVRELIDDDRNWLTWDYNSRLSLLQGLMDSDGSITLNTGGHQRYNFSSTNIFIIGLVRDLVRSLGGKCYEPFIDTRDKYSTGYCARLSINGSLPLFRWREQKSLNRFSSSSTITSIEPLGYEEESTCLTVDAEDHLYVTEGFKLTHNSFVLKHFISKIKSDQIILTAPTSEALEVIAEGLPGYSAMTVHKLLGYRPTATSNQDQILVRAGSKFKDNHWVDPPPKIVSYQYVILDEAYYCPAIIINAILNNYRHIKWIFTGDYKQLCPVNESESALLQHEENIHFKHDLTEDMRSTCPIQKNLISLVREKGLSTDFSPYILTKSKALGKIMTSFTKDPTNFSFLSLAYEHRVVDKVAEDLREILFNLDPGEPPQPGEIIRTTGVVDSDGNSLVRTNERVKVIEHHHDLITVERGSGEVVTLDLDHTGELKRLYDIAMVSRETSDWRTYHRKARQYVQIKSATSMTIHSSQGRTVENSLIILDSMRRCRSNNLCYVGVGRSKNVPWIVESW